MDKGIEMIDESIPAGDDTFVFVKPSKQAFNLPTPTVTPECSTVLRHGLDAITLVWCDQFNALGRKALIERIAVVGKIPNKSSGSSQGEGLIEGSLDKGDFMWRSRSRVHGEWKTCSVRNNHELRTFAPLGLSHAAAPFFATTKVPSIKHSERLQYRDVQFFHFSTWLQSIFNFAARTISAHLLTSLATSDANSFGVLPSGSAPSVS